MQFTKSSARYVQVRSAPWTRPAIYRVVEKRKDHDRTTIKRYKRIDVGIDIGSQNEPSERITVKNRKLVRPNESTPKHEGDSKRASKRNSKTSKGKSRVSDLITNSASSVSSLFSERRLCGKATSAETSADSGSTTSSTREDVKDPPKRQRERTHELDRPAPRTRTSTARMNHAKSHRRESVARPASRSAKAALLHQPSPQTPTSRLMFRPVTSPTLQTRPYHTAQSTLKMVKDESLEAKTLGDDMARLNLTRRESTHSPFQQPQLSPRESTQLVFGTGTRVDSGHYARRPGSRSQVARDVDFGEEF
ncbi:hypothetical protein EK21DRAFT_89477 [Setomelanomma holmii]|uniref:Uncharacterized protein n=1 Tax=Setomelanomma holmii TaxID=210430 RepID=A0A9P4LM51_9PLEO|nr:hypothetical protein EK21DRAFT_89477 [Setomelanomma holmii]